MEEKSYTSTHPLGHNRACNGNTLPLYLQYLILKYCVLLRSISALL